MDQDFQPRNGGGSTTALSEALKKSAEEFSQMNRRAFACAGPLPAIIASVHIPSSVSVTGADEGRICGFK